MDRRNQASAGKALALSLALTLTGCNNADPFHYPQDIPWGDLVAVQNDRQQAAAHHPVTLSSLSEASH